MKDFKVGINLGWYQEDASNDQILNQYQNWLDICSQHNINLVRIFLTRWSINALFSEEKLDLLIKVINIARQKDIEVIVVLNNFTDFIIQYFKELANDKYTWKSYPFRKEQLADFFEIIDESFLSKVKNVLGQLKIFTNVKKIELFNEIDSVQLNNLILINWVEQLNKELRDYCECFVFYVSIANQKNLNFFQSRLSIPVDIHLYNFPFEYAFKNLEYFKNKLNIGNLIGEFAKFSDDAHLSLNKTKTYFCSGLWGAYLLKLANSPLHWWWQDFLNNGDYLKMIDIFYKYRFYSFVTFENFDLKDIRIAKENVRTNEMKEKIFFRLKNLIVHPTYFGVELESIVKFFKKMLFGLRGSEQVLIRGFQNDKGIYFYCEPKNYQKITFDLSVKTDIKYTNVEIINLFTGQIREMSENVNLFHCKIANNSLIRIIKSHE